MFLSRAFSLVFWALHHQLLEKQTLRKDFFKKYCCTQTNIKTNAEMRLKYARCGILKCLNLVYWSIKITWIAVTNGSYTWDLKERRRNEALRRLNTSEEFILQLNFFKADLELHIWYYYNTNYYKCGYLSEYIGILNPLLWKFKLNWSLRLIICKKGIPLQIWKYLWQ